jgi:2-polyprenyl-6-methoxyphenol hydroxylase-like FAD-dependent oxidoreductase
METALKTPVLIVGAGPTGLTMAAQLIRHGIDFVLIDKKDGPTELSKALVVHARTLEIFDQLGIARKAISRGQIVQQAAFMTNGRVGGRVKFSQMGQGLSPFPFMLIYEQSKTEQLLYHYLQEHGKHVQWQTELVSSRQDDQGVTAVFKSASGESQTIEARYLIGADGASSSVRHLLDLGFVGTTHPRLFFVADVEMTYEGEPDTLYAAFHGNSFLLMVPMQGGQRWRLISNLPEDGEQAGQEMTPADIETKVQALIQRPLSITQVHWFSTYKIHTRHVEKFSLGRCFLVGDAAHIHTPAGGQGMNTGIQDAYNLAWKMAFVLRGHAGDALLETYNEERIANAKDLLKSTDGLFDSMAADHWYTHFLRDNFVPGLAGFLTRFGPVQEIIFPRLSQTGVTYRRHSLSQHHGDAHFKVKAGDRMPYFLVDGENLYDRLRAPTFHLVIFSDGTSSYPDLRAAAEAEFATVLDSQVLPLYPHVIALFGSDKPFMVLLRPDNHIGMIAPVDQPAALRNYLSQVVGLAPLQRT